MLYVCSENGERDKRETFSKAKRFFLTRMSVKFCEAWSKCEVALSCSCVCGVSSFVLVVSSFFFVLLDYG